MTPWVRLLVAAVVLVHGLIHLLGAAKGLGWLTVSQLKEPISTSGGWSWLAAAVVVGLAGVLMGVGATWWGAVAAIAAVVSQLVISTSWSDAKAGTAVNVILLIAAVYGFAAHGPTSYDAEWHSKASRALTMAASPHGVVSEADLASLPAPLADYLRGAGAVGAPRVTSFYATFHGRIRSGPDKPWMSFTGKQLNTYGASPQRLFLMKATVFGVPIEVLHVFADMKATMRGKILSLVPIVNAAGTEMDRGETVTLFNDLAVLSPAAFIDSPVTWSSSAAQSVRGNYTIGPQTVAATLAFSSTHELIDFVSDDRLRAAANGSSFTRQRWSTPLVAYRNFGPRRVAVDGQGRWHAPAPEGEFAYLEFKLDDIIYNPTHPGGDRRPPARGELPEMSARIAAG